MNGKYYAFTLAEVLITLVIIGVIAAMTIPTLINKTNKQEYVSRLKKTYSTLAQATNRIIADAGNPRADIGGWATSQDAVYQQYKKYLSNAKDCNLTRGCFPATTYLQLDGSTGTTPNNWNSPKLMLADGVSIVFDGVDASCSMDWDGKRDDCTQIWVDINGAKGPNQYGKDFYAFVLKNDGLHPRGCNNTTDCRTTGTGKNCACRVLRENAINYW